MKTRLPLLVERTIAEASVARTNLVCDYDVQLRARLTEEGGQLSCKQGCSNCCYHPVYLSLLEGASLYGSLVADGLWTPALKNAFKEASSKTLGLAPEVWSLSLLRCPLLDGDNLCGAYGSRPFACRVTYSIGDPKACHPHNLGPGMLPKRELLEAVTLMEAPLLQRHGLNHVRVPLATAVLMGEKIVEGDVALEDSYKSLGNLG
jgi:Fe-S-cluster containining protein